MEIYYNGIDYVGSDQQDVAEDWKHRNPRAQRNPGRHRVYDACRGIPGITCYPCEGGTNYTEVFLSGFAGGEPIRRTVDSQNICKVKTRYTSCPSAFSRSSTALSGVAQLVTKR